MKTIGNGVVAVQGDVAKLADVDKFYAEVSRKLGKIDVLFVNAGVAKFAPFAETSESTYDENFDINMKGAYFTIQKALPLLNDGASIILNTSVVGQKVPRVPVRTRPPKRRYVLWREPPRRNWWDAAFASTRLRQGRSLRRSLGGPGFQRKLSMNSRRRSLRKFR